MMKIKFRKKEIPCPKCGSVHTVPILYGLLTEEAIKEVEKGKAAMGGCMVSREALINS
ncbi:hypothetical protein [uncultured Dialister sp.]|jgi:hypothetical protein|uniref:hypothetical protein n=1 Tax=uncultured Dialister sp. TaxID=278064 RepID=UPI0025ECD3CE|nr:hypothetical protein [uncultured Dialister sp.]